MPQGLQPARRRQSSTSGTGSAIHPLALQRPPSPLSAHQLQLPQSLGVTDVPEYQAAPKLAIKAQPLRGTFDISSEDGFDSPPQTPDENRPSGRGRGWHATDALPRSIFQREAAGRRRG